MSRLSEVPWVSAFFTGIVLVLSLATFAAGSAPLQDVLPAKECAHGWPLDGGIKTFDKENLFDHIDGEAELYFPYGFEMLAAAVYTKAKEPDSAIIADVYRMGSLLDAFGIYSNYRRESAATAPVGDEGFVSPTQLMFYQDRYFVRIQSSGATGPNPDVLLSCAREISRKLPQGRGRPELLNAITVEGIVRGTERYISQGLLGYDFLRRGVTADALLKNERVQVFVVPEDSPGSARQAFDRYRSYLKASGKEVHDVGSSDSLSGTDPLYGGVLAELSGSYIVGAVRLKDPAAAGNLVDRIRQKLQGLKNAK